MPRREDDELPVPAPDEGGSDEVGSSSSPKPKPIKGPQSSEGKRKASEAGKRGHAQRTQTATLRQVRQSIAETAGKSGAMLLPVSPLPGAYLIKTSDELADVVVRLAERNPQLLATLAKSSVAMDYVALGSWAFGFLVAVGVQYGRIPVDSPMVEPFGIGELYDELAEAFEATEDVSDGASGNGHVADAAAPIVA